MASNNSFAKRSFVAIAKLAAFVLFWGGIWHLTALYLDNPLVLPEPLAVFARLLELPLQEDFALTVASSAANVLTGFFIGCVCGFLAAFLCFFIPPIRILLSPVITVLRATPVTSVVILIWVAVGSVRLPSIVAAVMVIPIVFANIFEGLGNADPLLKEVCFVYRMPFVKRLRLLYLPSVAPFARSALVTAAGLAWKATVAAEVIAYVKNTIGREIFDAKAYLMTVDLYAWTVLVIFCSLAIEALLRFLLLRKGVTASLDDGKEAA